MVISRLRFSASIVSLAVLATTARASGIPSQTNSTVPTLIRLVGANASVPDAAAGQFKVMARDLANNPMPNFSITIDLSNCPDLELCSDQLDASAVGSCAAKTVQKFTNLQGEVTFTIVGSSKGGSASSLANSARIFGRGVLMGSPSAAAFDLDGFGGVGAGDLAVWLTDFGSGTAWARSDFDGNGSIGSNDLAQWLTVFGEGQSAQSCGASCP